MNPLDRINTQLLILGYQLTHGWVAWAAMYAMVAFFSLGGLRAGKAGWKAYLAWPGTSAITTMAAAGLIWLVLCALRSLAGISLSLFPYVAAGTLLCMVSGIVGGQLWARLDSQRMKGSHTRGTVIVEGARFQHRSGRQIKKRARKGLPPLITLSGVAVGIADEVVHFIILGVTGMGKSTLIREMMYRALHRGDRLVVADPDGGYLARFYDPKRGDVILNPFDARSARWDLFGELKSHYDIDLLVRSLIPDEASEANGVWVRYARTLLESVLRQLKAAKIDDLGELFRLLYIAEKAELRELLKGTAASAFLDESSDKQFAGARSNLTECVKFFEYLKDQTGRAFSVREWVRNAPRGVLYLPYQADQIPALKGVISTWMRLAMTQLMSQKEHDYRLWFVVDELDALGAIDGLGSSLPRLRKFGGRCVLGLQAISQINLTYGAGAGDTMVENCNTKMILKCSASEGGGTACFASQLIGDREVIRVDRSMSQHAGNTGRHSESHAERRTLEPAVLPSDISKMPKGMGYLKVASHPDWLLVKFPEYEPPRVADPFVPGGDFSGAEAATG